MVAALLAIVFLSQSPSFKPIVQNAYDQTSKNIGPYVQKGQNWFAATIYPRMSAEAQKRGTEAKQEVVTQRNNAIQSIGEKVKDYLFEKTRALIFWKK